MGGKNPYIEQTKYTTATKKYKVTFVTEGKTVEIDPDESSLRPRRPARQHPGYSQGYHMGLDHACGGVCACSTCHVIVHEGLESCNEASDAELDQLDEAPGVTPKSRLGCQCVPDGTEDIVVEIPEWNQQIREGSASTRNWRRRALRCGGTLGGAKIWIGSRKECRTRLIGTTPRKSASSSLKNIRRGPADCAVHGPAQMDRRAARLYRRSETIERRKAGSHSNGLARRISGYPVNWLPRPPHLREFSFVPSTHFAVLSRAARTKFHTCFCSGPNCPSNRI